MEEGFIEKLSPFNETITVFENTINQGILAIGPYTLKLLTALLTIEVVVVALLWASSGGVQLGKALQRLFVVTLIAGLLFNNGQNYKDAVGVVKDSAEFVGSRVAARAHEHVSGSPQASYTPLSVREPDTILQRGFELVGKQVFESTGSVWSLATSLFIVLLAFGTLMAFALLALVCALTYIELQLLMVCGLVLLPFGAFRPTAFLAEKVFGLIVAFAVRILVLSLMIGVADARLGTLTAADTTNIPHMITLLVLVLVLCVLAWHAPSLAAGLLTGTPNLSPGQGVATGAAMVGSQVARTAGFVAATPALAAAGAAAGVVAGYMGAADAASFRRAQGPGGTNLSGPNPPGSDASAPNSGGDPDTGDKGGGGSPGTNGSEIKPPNTPSSKDKSPTAEGGVDEATVKASQTPPADGDGKKEDDPQEETPKEEDASESADEMNSADGPDDGTAQEKQSRWGRVAKEAKKWGGKAAAKATAMANSQGGQAALGGVFGAARAVRAASADAPSRALGGAFSPSMYFDAVAQSAAITRQTAREKAAPAVKPIEPAAKV